MKTLQVFFDALPKTGWVLDYTGNHPGRILREDNRDLCPYLFAPWNATIFLDYDVKKEIWKAADKDLDHDPELRAQLLEACGLLPEQEARQ